MDFDYHYSAEQEQFRREVSGWMDANLPEGIARVGVLPKLDATALEEAQNFRHSLGDQGWLDLDTEMALVFLEELGKRRLGWLLDDGSSTLQTALRQKGTEEQQKAYLPLLGAGQANVWRPFLETGTRLDVGNLGIQASREGDDIILNGQDAFTGQGLWPDYVWTLAIVNPEAPPEQATATFLVPSGLPGITIETPNTLAPGQVRRVAFDHVHVFPDALLGDEGSGWSLIQSASQAPQTIQFPSVEDADVADLLEYARETIQDGESLGKEPVLAQLLVEAYLNSRITRLFKIRNAWLASTGQPLTYHLAETALWEKQISMRLSRIVRDVMGMYALLDPEDPRAPRQASPQYQQLASLAMQHPTAAPEPYAVALAEHLGLGKGADEAQDISSQRTPAGISRQGDV